MKKRLLVCAIVTIACLAAASAGIAQMYEGWSQQEYTKLYDPKAVQTVKGQVIGIQELIPIQGMEPGVSLTIRPDGGGQQIIAHVGPDRYVMKQKLPLALHEVVELTGSFVTFEGAATIIAAQIKIGGKVYKFRDPKTGAPLWAKEKQ